MTGEGQEQGYNVGHNPVKQLRLYNTKVRGESLRDERLDVFILRNRIVNLLGPLLNFMWRRLTGLGLFLGSVFFLLTNATSHVIA